jgi:hypothetical protein
LLGKIWTWQNGKQSTWQNSQANNIPHMYTRGESTHKPEKLNGIKWETIESSPPEPIKGSDVHLFSPFGNHVQICRFKNFKVSFTICRGWTSFIVHYIIIAIGDALIIMLSIQICDWERSKTSPKLSISLEIDESLVHPYQIISSVFGGENRFGWLSLFE